jgi:hypothetical protein
MDVGIDEGGSEHETVRVDHPVLVGVDLLAELHDDPIVDADIEHRVNASRRVEQASAADEKAVLRSVLHVQHYATSSSIAASTGTGPCVSRS